jgi:hypothetical protein
MAQVACLKVPGDIVCHMGPPESFGEQSASGIEASMSYIEAEDEKAAGLNNNELVALLLVLLPKLGTYDVAFRAVSNKRFVLCVFHVLGSVQGLVPEADTINLCICKSGVLSHSAAQ